MRILKIQFLTDDKERFFCQRCYDRYVKYLAAKEDGSLQNHYVDTQVVGIWNPEWADILWPMEPPANASQYVCEMCQTDGKEPTECRPALVSEATPFVVKAVLQP